MRYLWLLLLLLSACAPKTPLVGVLVSGPGRMERVSGLLEALRQPGNAPKTKVCNAKGDPARLTRCARELEREGARVLVTVGGIETKSALAATAQVPILYVGLAASLDWGFVRALRAPGGRVSGVDNGYAELTGKRLEWWLRAFPSTKRVLVLYQPPVIPTPRALIYLKRAANLLNLDLRYFPVTTPKDLNKLAPALEETHPDVAILLPSHILENRLDRVLETLNAAGVPLIGLNREQTDRGAALSYGASNRALGRQAARMVEKVLAGYPVAKLPVERPDLPELTLNQNALNRLGLSPTALVEDLVTAP